MNQVVSYYRNKAGSDNFAELCGPSQESYPNYPNAMEMVRQEKPTLPVYTLNPSHIRATGKEFVENFPGTTMFAVKTNPDPVVLQNLCHAGVKTFDVASIEEIRLVRAVLPQAIMYFMHTVKSPENIHEAYFEHGIRHFVLDHEDELKKIMRVTNNAGDLHLFVRIALPKNENASIDLSSKFGAQPDEAVKLLKSCRNNCVKLGIAFHVGTQISDAAIYANAIRIVRQIIDKSNVCIDVLDIGGGFPVSYEGENMPNIHSCFDILRTALAVEGLNKMELLAEPGRVLVAQGGSLVVRVEARRGNCLYINDGTYGGLFDAGKWLNTRFPVQAIRPDEALSKNMQEYSFAGPTCDSLDMMEGPFLLPEDIREGDWIEIKNTGAYSHSMRTNFNGFGQSETVLIAS